MFAPCPQQGHRATNGLSAAVRRAGPGGLTGLVPVNTTQPGESAACVCLPRSPHALPPWAWGKSRAQRRWALLFRQSPICTWVTEAAWAQGGVTGEVGGGEQWQVGLIPQGWPCISPSVML